MNFELTTEQQQLKGLIREILEDACPTPVREVSTLSPLGATLAETGLAGILVPETLGGSGATLIEACILGEAFGTMGAPGALVASTLMCGAALDLVRDADKRSVADVVMSGEPCALLVGGDLSWPPGTGEEGEEIAWGWLERSVVLVPDGDALALAQGDDFSLSQTADLSLFAGRRASRPGSASSTIASSPGGRRFLAAANVIMSSVLLGHMQAAFDAAVEYSKHRIQYGAHIGSFQAVRHLCADMLVDVDASRSAAYGAAWAVSSSGALEESERSAAVAKAWCSDAGLRVCETSLQVHGGIGFTWESVINDHLRATHVARASFMSPEQALDLIAGARSWI